MKTWRKTLSIICAIAIVLSTLSIMAYAVGPTVNITMNNDGEITTEQLTVGDPLPTPKYNSLHEEFQGWYTDPVNWTGSITAVPDADTTVYAKYPSVVIEFNNIKSGAYAQNYNVPDGSNVMSLEGGVLRIRPWSQYNQGIVIPAYDADWDTTAEFSAYQLKPSTNYKVLLTMKKDIGGQGQYNLSGLASYGSGGLKSTNNGSLKAGNLWTNGYETIPYSFTTGSTLSGTNLAFYSAYIPQFSSSYNLYIDKIVITEDPDNVQYVKSVKYNKNGEITYDYNIKTGDALMDPGPNSLGEPFQGWYTDPVTWAESSKVTTMPAGDLEVYAKYASVVINFTNIPAKAYVAGNTASTYVTGVGKSGGSLNYTNSAKYNQGILFPAYDTDYTADTYQGYVFEANTSYRISITASTTVYQMSFGLCYVDKGALGVSNLVTASQPYGNSLWNNRAELVYEFTTPETMPASGIMNRLLVQKSDASTEADTAPVSIFNITITKKTGNEGNYKTAITMNNNGVITTEKLTVGDDMPTLPITSDGERFLGWYTDCDTWTGKVDKVPADITTLYARYPSVTVNFNNITTSAYASGTNITSGTSGVSVADGKLSYTNTSKYNQGFLLPAYDKNYTSAKYAGYKFEPNTQYRVKLTASTTVYQMGFGLCYVDKGALGVSNPVTATTPNGNSLWNNTAELVYEFTTPETLPAEGIMNRLLVQKSDANTEADSASVSFDKIVITKITGNEDNFVDVTTFNNNGVITVEGLEPGTAMPNPGKNEFDEEFQGWYTDPVNWTESSKVETVPTEPTVVYAKYASVVLDFNNIKTSSFAKGTTHHSGTNVTVKDGKLVWDMWGQYNMGSMIPAYDIDFGNANDFQLYQLKPDRRYKITMVASATMKSYIWMGGANRGDLNKTDSKALGWVDTSTESVTYTWTFNTQETLQKNGLRLLNNGVTDWTDGGRYFIYIDKLIITEVDSYVGWASVRDPKPAESLTSGLRFKARISDFLADGADEIGYLICPSNLCQDSDFTLDSANDMLLKVKSKGIYAKGDDYQDHQVCIVSLIPEERGKETGTDFRFKDFKVALYIKKNGTTYYTNVAETSFKKQGGDSSVNFTVNDNGVVSEMSFVGDDAVDKWKYSAEGELLGGWYTDAEGWTGKLSTVPTRPTTLYTNYATKHIYFNNITSASLLKGVTSDNGTNPSITDGKLKLNMWGQYNAGTIIPAYDKDYGSSDKFTAFQLEPNTTYTITLNVASATKGSNIWVGAVEKGDFSKAYQKSLGRIEQSDTPQTYVWDFTTPDAATLTKNDLMIFNNGVDDWVDGGFYDIIFDQISVKQHAIFQDNMDDAREIAADSFVLLKNENNALPINPQNIDLYGTGSYFGIMTGAGSGCIDANRPYQIYSALEHAGYTLSNIDDKDKYLEYIDSNNWMKRFNTQWGKWTQYLGEPTGITVNKSENTDVAIVTISRCSGEDQDLKLAEGGWYLTAEEKALLTNVCNTYEKKILIYNTANFIDPTLPDGCDFDAILFIGTPGQTLGGAVADVISGKVNPSGKLASTWTVYEDYPTSGEGEFAGDTPSDYVAWKYNGGISETLYYNESIYVGYRYFDTFGVTAKYPFTYGLSYTTFSHEYVSTVVSGTKATVTVKVTNTGTVAGKESVFSFITAPDNKLERATHELSDFIKTGLLQPGTSENVVLEFDLVDFTAYDESTASSILEAGKYIISVGGSLATAEPCSALNVANEVVTLKTYNRFQPNKTLNLITKTGKNNTNIDVPTYNIDASGVVTKTVAQSITYTELVSDGQKYTYEDVKNNVCTVEQFVAQFTNEQLSYMVNGVIADTSGDSSANVGSMSKEVPGAAGETYSSSEYKIPASVVADGASGIRAYLIIDETNAEYPNWKLERFSWPCAMIMACSFDKDSMVTYGRGLGDQMEKMGVDGLLAPGINIHRNPLCGRTFEYYSEDPVVAAIYAANTSKGVQTDENGISRDTWVQYKHMAVNNAENQRYTSDSVVSERAMREIYLKNFELAIKYSDCVSIMSSYNLINGVHASSDRDMLTMVLREEWGWEGLVMSDWNDYNPSEGYMQAGCDIIMPGKLQSYILKGLNNGTISRADTQHAVVNLINHLLRTNAE